MNNALKDGWKSFSRLFRFLLWYGVAVAAAFYLLPLAAGWVDGWYDELSSSARFLAILGFFSVIAVWQVLASRDRRRAWSSRNLPGPENS